MARVVLVWNEHPVEVVAGYHCRKVAKLLRKMGHEVIVEKIPAKETNYGILQGKSTRATISALRKLKPSQKIASEYAKKHGAITFNFHCSPEEEFPYAKIREPQDFRVGDMRSELAHLWGGPAPEEIQITPLQGNAAVIELPARYFALSERMKKKRGQLIERTLKKMDELDSPIAPTSPLGTEVKKSLKLIYQLSATKLNHPEQQKYLHPAISEKIAAAIHKQITPGVS